MHLSPLTQGTRIWQDEAASVKYAWEVQIPQLAIDLYMLPSEVLTDRAAKTMVLVDLPKKVVDDYKKLVGFEIGLIQTGAVASRSGLADNDIDLFLDGSLRVGRGIPGESTVILGEWSLVSDIALEMSLSNEVFTLVFEVVAFLHIMSVLSVEVIISSFVTPFWVCFDWVRGPEEPLFSNLEEDLNSG
ncbi:hypothetical protein BHM03_00030712 [Ensete ventricosum]|nr:hypothetical protein BHM03_00030712 [Ensete ventricosum]